MTVKELIAHLQTFDENAVVVVSAYSDYGDYIETLAEDRVEARGKYVVLLDNMNWTEAQIEADLAST